MNNIRITNACIKHPADDKRVFGKIARALTNQEFSVYIIAPNWSGNDVIDNVQIETFQQGNGVIRRIMSYRAMYRLLKHNNPDVIIAHEPDSLLISYFYKKNHKNARLIFDCHEAYEYWYSNKLRVKRLGKIIDKAIYTMLLALIKRIDAVISVNQTMTKRFSELNSNSFFIPSVSSDIDYDFGQENHHNNGVVFFGNFLNSRLFDIMLDSAVKLKSKGHTTVFAIIGGSTNQSSLYKYIDATKQKDVEEYFVFHGWLNHDEAIRIMRTYPVGVVRFDSYTIKNNHALPNKLFEYMANGLAILASAENIEIASIVNSNNCGIVISSESVDEFTEAVQYLDNNRSTVCQMGENAINACKTKYNWQVFGQKLSHIVKNLT